MFRGPIYGNGKQSPVYFLYLLRKSGGGSPGAGGRRPLRVMPWTALVVVAFRGIIAIIFTSSGLPEAGTGPGTGGKFPVSLAEAYATEFGRVYLGFSPQSLGRREQPTVVRTGWLKATHE